MPSGATVAVLGAGLTGVGVALELARQGVAVTLVDQDERPMNRASLRNEGKIHLGLIYANDPTFQTARLQLSGALRFRSLLERWIGARASRLPLSTPFHYLVARDSLLDAARLVRHYDAVQAAYDAELAADPSLDYLGTRPGCLWTGGALDDISTFVRVDRLAASFRTAELAVDTDVLSTRLRDAVARSPLVTFRPGHRVIGVDRRGDSFAVEGDGESGPWRLAADQVVNALWDQRLAIDAASGMTPVPGWVHRLKYRVIVRLPDRLRAAPSMTMVLGRYGDVVVRPDGTAYLSWYPSTLRGWTHDLAPPTAWNDPCRGKAPRDVARSVAVEVLAAIDAWCPGIGASVPLVVDAGSIMAYGHTDVDDASSALHDRSRIGVTSVNGYHSVDPGKLTTAPLFAEAAARRVLEVLAPA